MRNPTEIGQRGFTMIEILVTITLLGIVLGLAVPSFQRSFENARFERATTELQSDLKLAISTAKATGRVILIDFNPDGYSIVDANDSTRVYGSAELAKGIKLAAVGDATIFPWGLVQSEDVVFANGNRQEMLSILPTGRVECGQAVQP